MNSIQKDVLEFMQNADQYIGAVPHLPDREVVNFRLKLIQDEVDELKKAANENNLIEVYDGIEDAIYTLVGFAITCGLDIQMGWDEVHKSNMTKFIDGYKREDGKWIKGPSFRPPVLGPIIDIQCLGYCK